MRKIQNFPLVTLAVLVAAIAASMIPTLARVLVYDRAAIAAGQWWRLFTGNWVHFSTDHLFYDALAVGITAWMIERQDRRGLALLLVTTAGAIGSATFFFAPGVTRYGGLSGIACATVAYLFAPGVSDNGPRRWLSAVALALLMAKVGWECVTGRALFVATRPDVALLPLAHLVGLLVGTSQAAVCTAIQSSARSEPATVQRWEDPQHAKDSSAQYLRDRRRR